MASGLTLDAGALIAAEKQDRAFYVLWKEALDRRARVTLPAVVLAQVWRGNSPVIARLLPSCSIEDLDEDTAKAIGVLLGKARRSDVVDAVVVLGAASRGDAIVTSDRADIDPLVAAIGAKLRILDL
ncbi:MAG TPA: PIN domain-containing protein [Polyangia bacterium]|nr:PIN domain-containing protein [Polyangia bacterium]